MEFSRIFHFDIESINIAHEGLASSVRTCDYTGGRAHYGIVFDIEGAAEYKFTNGDKFTIGEGEILILAPTAAYSIACKGEFRHYTVNFDIHEESSEVGFLEKGYYLLLPDGPEKYKQQFKRIVASWRADKEMGDMLSIAKLYELLSDVHFELYTRKNTAASFLRLAAAKDYIEGNYKEPISLEHLAALSNMSVTNFRREWAKAYKDTPLRYRDKLRLAYAKEYLLSGYYNVSETAEKCGFCDTNYFVRFFRAHTGISPGKFKNGTLP